VISTAKTIGLGILFYIVIFFGAREIYLRFFQQERYYSLPPSAVSPTLSNAPTPTATIVAGVPSTGKEQISQSAGNAVTSVEQLFTGQMAAINPEKDISLLVTGDVLTARSVNNTMTKRSDFTWPFIHTKELTSTADISFINLETPLIKECPLKVDGMIFCGNPKSIEGLQFAGIDVVNIANNHASNYRPEGVLETVATLKQAGLQVSGQTGSNLALVQVKDTTFGFLGYNEVNIQDGITLADDETIKNEIAEAQEKADIVVVQFHWGNEYTRTPSNNQKRLAHLAIDAGADMIVGNHPHWFQPVEFYSGKLIMYSHGNFVFDQMWSQETREGIIARYYFEDKKLIRIEFTPIIIENYGQPRIANEAEKNRIIEELKNVSLL